MKRKIDAHGRGLRKEKIMPSSDIYKVKDAPWAKAQKESKKSRRRRHRSESYDEVMNKDLSKTHRRRSKNSGVRRFRHQMKKPEFSKKFWTILLSSFGAILLGLIIWDQFIRYHVSEEETQPGIEFELDAE